MCVTIGATHLSLCVYLYPGARYTPNSHKALRCDPALIEDTAFNHMRNLSGDGRGLVCACACKDQLGGWVCLIEESWRDFRQWRGSLKKYISG